MSSYDEAMATSILAGVGVVYMIVLLAVVVALIVAYWKIFEKAGEPGWASLIPFYSSYKIYKIGMGNGWWFLLSLIPYVGFVMPIVLAFMIAKAFGRGVGFGFGLWLLAPIFYLILAFGSSEYQGA